MSTFIFWYLKGSYNYPFIKVLAIRASGLFLDGQTLNNHLQGTQKVLWVFP